MLKIIFLTLIINKTLTEDFLLEKGVSVLTTSKFQNFTTENKNSLILTYLPNCSHCKKILQYLPSLTKKLKKINVNVGKLNAESNKEYRKKVNTGLFPHLRLYINNLYIDYPFDLEEDKIYNWVKILIERNFDIHSIRNKKDLDKVLKENLALIFKYDKKDLNALEIIKTFSIIYNIRVYVYESKGLKDFAHDGDDYLFYLHRDFDDGDKSFSGKEGFSAGILQRFMEMFYKASINKMGEKVTNNVFRNKLKTFFVFDNNYDSEVMKIVDKLSVQFKGRLNFVKSNKKEVNAETLADLLAIEKLPAVRILDFGKESFLKYKPQDLKLSTLKKFIEDGINNKNEIFYKKEKLPKSQGFVKKVVRDNYKKIIMDPKKHVFVAFTTTWCEHCKEVDTAFNDIKKNILSNVKDLTFAKANYSLNDFDILIKSFPTIYLFKKGDKENPIEYDLIRDWEVMLDFIQSRIKVKLFNKPMPAEVLKDMPKMPEGAEQVEL